jgi:NitT/TauT family transport system substrate-binding protein
VTGPFIRRPLIATGAAGLLLALAACGGSSSGSSSGSGSAAASAKPTSLTMGIEPWIGYAPWYIAQEKGFFAKHGLDVKIVNFQQDADRNTALLAGKTDVSNIDAGRTVQFAASGKKATPLMIEDASTGADAILATKDVTNAATVTGQAVAYEFGTTSDLLLHYYLLKNSLATTAVKSTNIPAANAGSLIIAGKAKVAVTYEPYISEATSGAHGKDVHVLFSSADAPGLISDYLVANPTWLAANATAAKALVAAWNDAVTYFGTNRDDAVAIMAKGVGAKPADLAQTLAGVKIYSAAENKSLVASGELATEYASIGKTLQAMGTITAPVDLKSVADFSYLP